jgi:hypothetical protein
MHICKEQRICREKPSASKALRAGYVARITPYRYSVRIAIGRYRHIQEDDGRDSCSAFVMVRG